MSTIKKLTQAIEAGRLLTPATFPEDLDSALDDRDVPPFDSEWVRVDRLVKAQGSSVAADDRVAIDRLREVAFKTTFKHTRNPDAAAYISDDFGLIADALSAQIDDPWLNGLWDCYQSDRFPTGTIALVAGNLQALIDSAIERWNAHE